MVGFFPLLLQVSVKILMMMMRMIMILMMVVMVVVMMVGILKVWHLPPNIVSLLEKRHLKSHVPPGVTLNLMGVRDLSLIHI